VPCGASEASGVRFEAGGAEGFDDETAGALDAEGLARLDDLVAGVGTGDPELALEASDAGSALDGDAEDGAGGELVQVRSGLALTGRWASGFVLDRVRHGG
jgi:hypothetical protein